MAEEKTTPSGAPKTAPAPVRVRKFEAPSELDAKFGMTVQTEEEVSGYVETKDIRALLDAFGLDDRKEIQFPFQYMKRRGGELWRMRVEPAELVTLKGQVALAHQWTYTLDVPERISGAA